MRVTVCCVGGDVARFAGEELARYIALMDPRADVAAIEADSYDARREDAVWVGASGGLESFVQPVPDPARDDAIYASVAGARGVIAGSNERAALIAVYRLLREAGCVFDRPGAEHIPRVSAGDLRANIAERAAMRHRGVCIEGSLSLAHARAMIDWLPKIGLNAYYIQFFAPRVFFDRWYSHVANPLFASEPVSREDAVAFKRALERDISRRGLMYHDVGHGWTCEPFGLPGDTWERGKGEVPEDVVPALALVDGKRALFHGKTLTTNLCYGDASVRRRVAEAVCDYLEAHAGVDYLHLWLADAANSFCECKKCAGHRASDMYVKLLNDVDALLTARGIRARIVFLIYFDLMWPPVEETIANPERFTLMFAPITRSYSEPLPAGGGDEIPPFVLNKNSMPRDAGQNAAFLRGWQRAFGGDSFDFDYHLMWDHFLDLSYVSISRLLAKDMRGLADLGLNGMISCQNTRVFLPNALPMRAMAEALWNREADFEALARKYFAEIYGADADEAWEYLNEMSNLADAASLRGEKEPDKAKMALIPPLTERFAPVIERNLGYDPLGAWRALKGHARLICALYEALTGAGSREALWRVARETEYEFPDRFDMYEFESTIKGRLDRI